MARESMVFYRSFLLAGRKMNPKDRLAYWDAILGYGLDDEEPTLQGVPDMAFTVSRPQIDANKQRYSNGSKGGRPKKTDGYETEKPMVSDLETGGGDEKKPNVNVNVNVNEKDKDNENENVSVSIGDTQKKQIFQKFFFRNMTEPNKEVIRYLDWGESTDWVNKNGQKIKDVVKYSRFWTPEKEGKRFSPLALSILHKIWAETGNQNPAIQKLIFGIYKDSQVGSDLKLYTRQGAEKLAPYAKDIAAGFGFNIEIIQTN